MHTVRRSKTRLRIISTQLIESTSRHPSRAGSQRAEKKKQRHVWSYNVYFNRTIKNNCTCICARPQYGRQTDLNSPSSFAVDIFHVGYFARIEPIAFIRRRRRSVISFPFIRSAENIADAYNRRTFVICRPLLTAHTHTTLSYGDFDEININWVKCFVVGPRAWACAPAHSSTLLV